VTPLDGQDGRRGLFSKTRMEAFSDGVFAIAITLLVLDIAVKPGGTPLEELFSAWPTYVGYVVSFITIGAAWIAHTGLTDELVRVDPVFLRLNLLLLLFVVFLPFPTKLITEAFGDREAERVAATVYGLTLLVILLLTIALDRYSLRENLYKDYSSDVELDRTRRKDASGVILYVVALIAGLVVPGVAVTIYFGIALFLVIPFRELVHLRKTRSAAEEQ
jgi:uncharacterized membrane protein